MRALFFLLMFPALAACAEDKDVATTEEEMRAMIKDAASELSDDRLSYDSDGLALPPWEALPDIPRGSIGWRMGSGEDYWIEFSQWYRSLTPEQRAEYRELYQAPPGWEGFYDLIESRG